MNDTIKERLRALVSEVEKRPVDGKNMMRGRGLAVMGMPEFAELIKDIFVL